MARRWTVTVRDGPRVEHAHADSLDAAVDLVQRRLEELAPQVRRESIQVLRREFDPVRQVAVRCEITHQRALFSSVHGGIDVRGDGSAEAYTGRLRRSLVKPLAGESPYEALRRALRERTDGGGPER